ncbi:dynein light chain 1 axonemal [Drosophila madeirensis]|uniref:Dynein axonemal light chain 1 n=2 Tax=obscura subgroup TaxID=32357 RepID=A0A3B0JHU2_DROGU|nr:dynein light chain 1, axonemal [Drosophila guanche]XP_034651491.1 dynein light chain 1, axonemal [Drosophila subobscura]SPP72959.1 blast:Dynein light chain 1%2C axonemal [Drosophila guanche]
MSKATTIKEALKRWEDREQQNSLTAKDIDLQFQWPPIEKMDTTLGTLVQCERISMSTNMIEKIFGLSGMKCLKVLSLSRNYIKQISGLEAVAETLEELWLSYNLIEKIKGLTTLKCLKVLYISNNLIKDWSEFNRLAEIESLEDLVVVGNPLSEGLDDASWRVECIKRLPTIRKLDGEPVVLNDEPQL